MLVFTAERSVSNEQLVLILSLIFTTLNSVNFVLIRVSSQTPHVGAVAQESAGAVCVVSSLHNVDDRAIQVISIHETLTTLRLQVGRGARLLHYLSFCEAFACRLAHAEVTTLH